MSSVTITKIQHICGEETHQILANYGLLIMKADQKKLQFYSIKTSKDAPWTPEIQLQDSQWKHDGDCQGANSMPQCPEIQQQLKIKSNPGKSTWLIMKIYLILNSIAKRLNKVVPVKSHLNHLLKNLFIDLQLNIFQGFD